MSEQKNLTIVRKFQALLKLWKISPSSQNIHNWHREEEPFFMYALAFMMIIYRYQKEIRRKTITATLEAHAQE